uniref:Uncharacterized protein n=1 Tax=Anopheles atroparvus TaxID=41427 RepID=A0A182JHN3_ANOAO
MTVLRSIADKLLAAVENNSLPTDHDLLPGGCHDLLHHLLSGMVDDNLLRRTTGTGDTGSILDQNLLGRLTGCRSEQHLLGLQRCLARRAGGCGRSSRRRCRWFHDHLLTRQGTLE